MAHVLRFLSIAVIAITAATVSHAAGSNTRINADQSAVRKAEQNYIMALRCGNAGTKISAARMVADYGLKGSCADLVKLLKCDRCESVRIAAALALVKLDDREGIDAVKEASLYDGSDRVAKFCESVLEAYSLKAPAYAQE